MQIRKATTQFELFSIMQIRCKVFMCEQNVDPSLEIDDEDKTCIHYLLEDNDEIIATCRILIHEDTWHLGRLAILKEYRKKNYGSKLVSEMLNQANIHNIKKVELSAQLQAIPFYEKLGFVAYGELYLDANIEHRMMRVTI